MNRPGAAEPLAVGVAVACAWAAWLPLGAMYLAYGLALAFAAVVLTRTRHWRQALWQPLSVACAALIALLVLSAAWTPAPARVAAAHAGHYALLLGVPLVGAALPATAARRGLAHFVVAAALVGALAWIAPIVAPTGLDLLATTLHAEGNRRIAMSLLLALGAALGCAMALHGAAAGTRRAGQRRVQRN